jgi:WhiB family transcriptional regulator, redox-sensing transcriptional regulator
MTTNVKLVETVRANGTFSRWDSDDWRDGAKCFGMDTEIFFPSGDGELAEQNSQLAKNTCRTCGVRHECLEFAIATLQKDGIWGGQNEDDRRRLKRSRRLTSRVQADQRVKSVI